MKKNNTQKPKLLHACMVLLDTIRRCSEELESMKLKESDWKKTDDKRIKRALQLIDIMNVCNYAIFPSYDIMLTEYPGLKLWIETCKKNYENAVNKKVFPNMCECPACKELS